MSAQRALGQRQKLETRRSIKVNCKCHDLTREFLIVENIRPACQLDLTADFGVNSNAKLTPNGQPRKKAKLVFRAVSTVYTVTLTPILVQIS